MGSTASLLWEPIVTMCVDYSLRPWCFGGSRRGAAGSRALASGFFCFYLLIFRKIVTSGLGGPFGKSWICHCDGHLVIQVKCRNSGNLFRKTKVSNEANTHVLSPKTNRKVPAGRPNVCRVYNMQRFLRCLYELTLITVSLSVSFSCM